MRRRTLLRSIPVALSVASAGCSGLGLSRPEVRLGSGTATLHPASDLYINNGLQPEGDNTLFVSAAPDEAPGLVGPDAQGPIVDRLRNPGIDQFHVVIQLRSSPEAPIELWPEPGEQIMWTNRSTLRVPVRVEPWGSLDRIDDQSRRQRLQSANELVYTGVWSLSPSLDNLPEHIDLIMAT